MGVITIAGLGPGDPGLVSLAALEALRGSGRTWLRTEVHPVVGWLKEKGISFGSFDYIYRDAKDFQEVYRRIAGEILSLAGDGDVLYAVPGHPLVAEESVELILEGAAGRGVEVRIIPGMSFIDSLLAALKESPSKGLHVIDGLRLDRQSPDPSGSTVVTQAYSRLVLSDIKLSLMDHYPDDHVVLVITAAGVPGEEHIEERPLYELDRVSKVNHLTSVFIPPLKTATGPACSGFPLDPLVEVMARLRGPDGCPWDREQDHLSLRRYLLEEAYETVDALSRQDMYNICEELGDLLLQIVFHAQIASENGRFDINDVIAAITEKMIRRHPHVFGDIKVKSSDEVLVNWEAIKEKEKGGREGILDGMREYLPSLMRAQKLQSSAAKVGFDWPDYTGALEKLYEELTEMMKAVKSGSARQKEDEMGDVIFSVVNLSRLLEIDAEVALSRSIGKFQQRFRHVEEMAALSGRSLEECSLEEMDSWWDEAKKVEKSFKTKELFSCREEL
ncbi:MAG: nucleoside triphosphate pyrophosphohydrolase [Bacillota bacterium]